MAKLDAIRNFIKTQPFYKEWLERDSFRGVTQTQLDKLISEGTLETKEVQIWRRWRMGEDMTPRNVTVYRRKA